MRSPDAPPTKGETAEGVGRPRRGGGGGGRRRASPAGRLGFVRLVARVLVQQPACHPVGPAETVLQRILAATTALGVLAVVGDDIFFHQLALLLVERADRAQPAAGDV